MSNFIIFFFFCDVSWDTNEWLFMSTSKTFTSTSYKYTLYIEDKQRGV